MIKITSETPIHSIRKAAEPVHCMRNGCMEELNGTNCFCLNLEKDFIMEIWLCDECAKKFKKLVN